MEIEVKDVNHIKMTFASDGEVRVKVPLGFDIFKLNHLRAFTQAIKDRIGTPSRTLRDRISEDRVINGVTYMFVAALAEGRSPARTAIGARYSADGETVFWFPPTEPHQTIREYDGSEQTFAEEYIDHLVSQGRSH